VIYKFWRKISPWEKSNHRLAVIWKIAITFTFITFTRVFFRSESMEVVNGMLQKIFSFTDLSLIPQIFISYKWPLLVMLTGFVFHWLPYATKDQYRAWFIRQHFVFQAFIFAFITFVVYQSMSSEMQAFIYFQF
jgi:hypothetical protein